MTALLPLTTITAANTLGPVGGALKLNGAPRNLTIEAQFVYGSGGSSVDVYVQTSFDGGLSWVDVCNFHFVGTTTNALFNVCSSTPVTAQRTPTSGAITANTAVDGALGPQFRALLGSAGTYAGGTTVRVDVAADQLGFA